MGFVSRSGELHNRRERENWATEDVEGGYVEAVGELSKAVNARTGQCWPGETHCGARMPEAQRESSGCSRNIMRCRVSSGGER
jgi:hypothetical protein